MDAGLTVAIVFGIVTVVGVVIALLSYLKQNPKKMLEYRTKVVPLMRSTNNFSNRLTVSFDGVQMQEPHFVEVSVRSVGRVDIRRADFDGNQSLVFDLGPHAGPIDDASSSELWQLAGNRLELRPNLISRQHGEHVVRFLCSGKPSVKLMMPHSLADTTVRNGSSRKSDQQARSQKSITYISGGTLILTSIFCFGLIIKWLIEVL